MRASIGHASSHKSGEINCHIFGAAGSKLASYKNVVRSLVDESDS